MSWLPRLQHLAPRTPGDVPHYVAALPLQAKVNPISGTEGYIVGLIIVAVLAAILWAWSLRA